MSTFAAYEAWREHCAMAGIRDPWDWEREIESEYKQYGENIVNGVKVFTVSWKEPTEDQKRRLQECYSYRDKYITDREKWVGQYLFDNYGQRALDNFARIHSQNEEFQAWYQNLRPCEGEGRQCAFSCPVFQTCALKAQGVFK